MGLPFFQSEKNNIILGLFLKEEEGVCLILKKTGDRVKLIDKERFRYSNGWENICDDIDEILFKLESQYKLTVNKTIFFIYSHFVDEETGQILKSYLAKIKSLSRNLELEPIGYIECYEAVVNYLEEKEQLPLTSIILEIDSKSLDLFIYKGGHKVYFQKITKTDNITDDLKQAFQTIKNTTVLPSRIIIYNSDSIDEVSSQIVSERWSQEIFIQMPRVEIINEEEVYQSLVDLFNRQLSRSNQPLSVPEKKEVMGFVIGEEVNQQKAFEEKKPASVMSTINFSLLIKRFETIKTVIKIPSISLNLAMISGILLILFTLVFSELFLHQATVTIFLPYKEVKEELKIDSFKAIIASKSADLKKSKATTGKKQIGDKATGEVTIHSFDDKEKNFTKGTVIDGGGFQFTLDEGVKIASSSIAVDGSAKLPGKGTVKITAVSLGPESNLDKGKRFSIDTLSPSLFFAINESGLTGGTKKETTTVAKADIDGLTDQLLIEGKKIIERQQNKKGGDSMKMIIPLTEYKLIDVTLSKEIGEEASQIEATAKLVANYYGYQEKDLLDNFETGLIKKIPQGYSIISSNLSYKITQAEKTKDKISLIVDVNGRAIKDIDKNSIANKLPGKNRRALELLFKKDYPVDGFEMIVKPKIVFFENWLPLRKKNIQINYSFL